jgi:hypothetical protein
MKSAQVLQPTYPLTKKIGTVYILQVSSVKELKGATNQASQQIILPQKSTMIQIMHDDMKFPLVQIQRNLKTVQNAYKDFENDR